MRLGDLDKLKRTLKSNCKPELCHSYGSNWCEHCCQINDFEDLIDNAETVSPEEFKPLIDKMVELLPKIVDTVLPVVIENMTSERPTDKWGKWVISEIRCPICLEYFQPDCYSTEELKECPSCGAMLKGGAK